MNMHSQGARRKVTKRKVFLYVGAFFALWWMLPLGVKYWAQKGFYEFQAPLFYMQSKVEDLQSYWALKLTSRNDLIENGMQLARLAASYELAAQREAVLAAQLSRLEKLVNMPGASGFRCELARVVAREIDTWWHTVVIRKGTIHGVKEGFLVVYGSGVVGRVTQAHLYTAVVELVSSPRFRLPVNIEGDPRPILYQGSFTGAFESPVGCVGHVPADIAVLPNLPRRALTGSFSPDYPEGLTVGWVRALELACDGLFQWGEVALPEYLSELREVSVLIPVKSAQ